MLRCLPRRLRLLMPLFFFSAVAFSGLIILLITSMIALLLRRYCYAFAATLLLFHADDACHY